MKPGAISRKSVILRCVLDKQVHDDGSFAGQFPYPIVNGLQHHPGVNKHLRNVAFHCAETLDRKKGLIYRTCPFSDRPPNSWLTSAEAVMNSFVDMWGHITSDHVNRGYVLHQVKAPGRSLPNFPDVGDEVERLLAEFVIDRADHPVLQKLLGDTVMAPVQQDTPCSGDDEEDEDVY